MNNESYQKKLISKIRIALAENNVINPLFLIYKDSKKNFYFFEAYEKNDSLIVATKDQSKVAAIELALAEIIKKFYGNEGIQQ